MQHLYIAKPIVWLLRLVNSGQSTIGKFYEHMNQLIVSVKGMEEVDGLDAGVNTKLERFFNIVGICSQPYAFFFFFFLFFETEGQ
jgi:hypothetical protein